MAAAETAPVAVCIVSLNAGAHLPRALEALSRQTVAPARMIVADNGSTDGSMEGLEERHPAVEVLRLGENLGFATANNRAVACAEGCEWVALLNSDAFPEPDWLERLMSAAHAHPEAVALGSLAVSDADPARIDVAALRLRRSWRVTMDGHGSPAAQSPPAAEILVPSAVAALYRRDEFLACGGFDESFFCYFEDVDLALRLALRGGIARSAPDAVVRHVGSATTGAGSEFAVYHEQRNMVWGFVRTAPGPLLWLYLPLHVAANLGLVAWFAVRGRGRTALRAKRDAVRGLPAAWRARREIQAGRRIAPGDLGRMIRRFR